MKSIQENKRHTNTTFCKKNVVDTTLWRDCVKIKGRRSPPIKGVNHMTTTKRIDARAIVPLSSSQIHGHGILGSGGNRLDG